MQWPTVVACRWLFRSLFKSAIHEVTHWLWENSPGTGQRVLSAKCGFPTQSPRRSCEDVLHVGLGLYVVLSRWPGWVGASLRCTVIDHISQWGSRHATSPILPTPHKHFIPHINIHTHAHTHTYVPTSLSAYINYTLYRRYHILTPHTQHWPFHRLSTDTHDADSLGSILYVIRSSLLKPNCKSSNKTH